MLKQVKSILVTGLIFWCLFPLPLKAQIKIDAPEVVNQQTYKNLVKKTLIGNGVLTGHFQVTAPNGSIALFNFNTDQDLVKEGLILSTGLATDVAGPNDTTNTSSEFYAVGDADLSKLIGRLTSDAVAIEFDFIPYSDSIGFYYFFASEEYPEYVGKGFNDAFAFLIRGPGYPYFTNIARLKVKPISIPITIDNVNFIRHSEYFISNHLKQDVKLLKPKNLQKELGEPEMLSEIEFDGMTTKLRATAKVVRGEIYRLKIVIADVGDMRYDSGVFLEKESFGAPSNRVADMDTVALLQKFAYHYRNDSVKLRKFVAEHPVLTKPDIPLLLADTLQLTVYFQSDSFYVDARQKKELKKAIGDLSAFEKVTAQVKAHTDSTGTFGYNKGLSKKRAYHTSTFLRSLGINSKKVDWVADKEPKTANATPEGRKKNRRVDITIIKQP